MIIVFKLHENDKKIKILMANILKTFKPFYDDFSAINIF